MTGFEPWISGVRSARFINWTPTTAESFQFVWKHFYPIKLYPKQDIGHALKIVNGKLNYIFQEMEGAEWKQLSK